MKSGNPYEIDPPNVLPANNGLSRALKYGVPMLLESATGSRPEARAGVWGRAAGAEEETPGVLGGEGGLSKVEGSNPGASSPAAMSGVPVVPLACLFM